jgi:hypothetical protein
MSSNQLKWYCEEKKEWIRMVIGDIFDETMVLVVNKNDKYRRTKKSNIITYEQYMEKFKNK